MSVYYSSTYYKSEWDEEKLFSRAILSHVMEEESDFLSIRSHDSHNMRKKPRKRENKRTKGTKRGVSL